MELVIPPALPGLVVRRRLGAGSDAPWVARADDGTWLVVRPGGRPPGLPDHPCLLPVLGAVTDPSGRSWVLMPYRSGSGLDRRLDRLGRGDTALARMVGIAGARALAALHDEGLVHTDLGPHRVLLGSGDEVVVEATCARPGSELERRADLSSLGDLLEEICTPEGSLARAVEASRGGADARAVLALLRSAARRPEVARHARRSRPARVLAVAATVTVLLTGACLLGIRLADRPTATASLVPAAVRAPSPSPTTGEPTAVPTSEPAVAATAVPTARPALPRTPEAASSGPGPVEAPPVEPDWVSVLAGLDRARGAALAAADPALLAAVDVEGGVAHARDVAVVEALARGDVVAEGWATRLLSVQARDAHPGRAVLAVTDRLEPYVLRDRSGTVVAHRPARGLRDWLVHLRLTPDGWRIARVESVR